MPFLFFNFINYSVLLQQGYFHPYKARCMKTSSFFIASYCLHQQKRKATLLKVYFDMASFNPGMIEGFTFPKKPRRPWFLNCWAWSVVFCSVHLSQSALFFLLNLKKKKKKKEER